MLLKLQAISVLSLLFPPKLRLKEPGGITSSMAQAGKRGGRESERRKAERGMEREVGECVSERERERER